MLHFYMSWTPATSIGNPVEHPLRMRGLSEHRESTDLSRPRPEGYGPVGKGSPRFAYLFSRRSTPLSPFFSAFAHPLRAARADARAHSGKWKRAYSAQFWCNLTPLDATLVSLFVCVANKGLMQMLKSFRCNIYKNTGGGRRLHSFLLLHRHVTKNSSPQLLSNQHLQTVTPVSPLECAFTKTA